MNITVYRLVFKVSAIIVIFSFCYRRLIQQHGRLTLWLDYIPRYELLSNLQYFDTYYRGLDQAQYEFLQRAIQIPSGVVSLPAPTAVITRLLMSPLALYVGGSADDRDGVRTIAEAITTHVSICLCFYLCTFL